MTEHTIEEVEFWTERPGEGRIGWTRSRIVAHVAECVEPIASCGPCSHEFELIGG